MSRKLSANIELAKVRLLSLDVDGVLTDGGLYYDDEGRELRRFHVLDGKGIQLIQAKGIPVCIITHSTTKSIEHRAQNLGIKHCYTGIEDKLQCLNSLLGEIGISIKDVAHVADDVNDLKLHKSVGIPIAVQNAVPSIISVSKFVTVRNGGSGAVREVTDTILSSLVLLGESE